MSLDLTIAKDQETCQNKTLEFSKEQLKHFIDSLDAAHKVTLSYLITGICSIIVE